MSIALACVIYIAAMTAANLTVAAFGPWVSPLNSFLLIGLDLALRDRLHEAWRGSVWKMAALIAVASAASYVLNPASGKIALASFVAFAVSSLVDWAAYAVMRRRCGFMASSNGSNVAGAAVDSLIFPTLAFGAFLPHIVALQFAAKVAGGFAWSLALRRWWAAR
jgi:uncharacterized PurR-regulated membrane protein YhhQ (DUF165 family)